MRRLGHGSAGIGRWRLPAGWDSWPCVGSSMYSASTRLQFPIAKRDQCQSDSGVSLNGPAMGSLADVGRALFGPFALPFEIAGLVLLAAIVGAVVLARRRTEG